MAKKTGLGRGLDALFSDTIKEPEIEEVTGEIVQNIKITKITPEAILTPLAIFINAFIVSSFVCISSTLSNLSICSCTSLLFSKFVRVTT